MTNSPNAPTTVNMENFEAVVDSHPRVILDFWASWCAPCKMFAPIFSELAALNPDILFGTVDTEAASELAAAFQVRSVPTLMGFRDGELVFERSGVLPPSSFGQLLELLRSPSAGSPESI